LCFSEQCKDISIKYIPSNGIESDGSGGCSICRHLVVIGFDLISYKNSWDHKNLYTHGTTA